MKKKFKSVAEVLLVCVLAVTSVIIMNPVTAYASDVRLTVNGEIVQFDEATPIIVNDRTLVPLREVFEAMDFTVRWDSNNSTAILDGYGFYVTVTVGDDFIVVNGDRHYCDVPPQIINGRFMLPLRLVAEATGANVDWDGITVMVRRQEVEQLPGQEICLSCPGANVEADLETAEENDEYIDAVHPILTLSPEEVEMILSGTFDPETVQVIVNDEVVPMPKPLLNIEAGTVMLPVSYIAEALGYTVYGEGYDLVIGPGITFIIGEDRYHFGRMAPVELGAAPELHDGVIFVPWNFFGAVLPNTAAYAMDGNIYVRGGDFIDETSDGAIEIVD